MEIDLQGDLVGTACPGDVLSVTGIVQVCFSYSRECMNICVIPRSLVVCTTEFTEVQRDSPELDGAIVRCLQSWHARYLTFNKLYDFFSLQLLVRARSYLWFEMNVFFRTSLSGRCIC